MNLELSSGLRSGMTHHDRAVLTEVLFPDGPPPDTMVINAGRQAIALCCPVTRVALTRSMAEAVGLDENALTAMVERRCPLGISADAWDWTKRVLAGACSSALGGAAALVEDALTIAVGGSSVACFSSAKTAMEKKQFPRHESELELQILSSRLNKHVHRDHLADRILQAIELYRSLRLTRPPRAPWHGIMARLGIEGPPDVDLQIASTVVDSVLSQAARRDPSIASRRRADRLGRWHESDVHAAFPALAILKNTLREASLPVDLEFLGPGGHSLIQSRRDWWQLEVTMNGS